MRRIISLMGLLALVAAGLVTTAGAASAGGGGQTHVFVCKYVGKPGVDERLKDGKQPIYVAIDATAGTWFNDAQGRSYVLAVADETNTGRGQTYTGDLTCPTGQPAPQVLTSEIGKRDCEGVFKQVTTVTTPYVLNSDGQWVLDPKNAVTVVSDWIFVRALTPQERLDLECPLIVVTPQTPDVAAPTCTADGTLVLPTGPVGVHYDVKPAYDGPGQYTITAVADPGYVLAPAEHDWSWDLTVGSQLTGAQCTPVVTPGPANPQASIVTVCGHATFTLTNLTAQTTDESATFVTTINGKDSTQAVVKAGGTETLEYGQSVDVGVVHLGVKSGGVVLASADLQTKCGQGGVTPPKTTPPATQPVANTTPMLPHTGGGNALPIAGFGALLLLLGGGAIWLTRKV